MMRQQQRSDPWERGDAYERYVGRWSRQVAPLFLAWMDHPPGRKWLDVGWRTGALRSAILAVRATVGGRPAAEAESG
ncbi:hypothetical protein [Geothrix fuzhouensis]|uniref:hypothetical protein n=1 Tax=Geothrix fuzhouensis TaxID=2966451 RepID=UPI0021491AA2|nr:hypothetical protein [Geothrix fuzhouensis]